MKCSILLKLMVQLSMQHSAQWVELFFDRGIIFSYYILFRLYYFHVIIIFYFVDESLYEPVCINFKSTWLVTYEQLLIMRYFNVSKLKIWKEPQKII